MENGTNKEKLIIPITVLLACIIIGGFLYAIQVSKQNSIEKQEAMKLENETKKEQLEKQDRQKCNDEAGEKARELLRKKAEMYPNDETYKKGIEQDLFIKDDFTRYYEQCLSKNGLQK